MTRIYIVGAGGFGREVYAWLTMGSSLGRSHQVAGFLDDNPSAISPGWGPHGVVGGIRAYEPQHGDLLVLALGDPRAKLRVAEALLARGGEVRGVGPRYCRYREQRHRGSRLRNLPPRRRYF